MKFRRRRKWVIFKKWLASKFDPGETLLSTEQEKAYKEKLVEDMPETKALEAQEEKDELRADAIAHWTRFLRLSYYMTGR